jgi:hypothetical protein
MGLSGGLVRELLHDQPANSERCGTKPVLGGEDRGRHFGAGSCKAVREIVFLRGEGAP